ncbi:MAG: RNA polymerase sigma factor [Planctomycetota bacterium]
MLKQATEDKYINESTRNGQPEWQDRSDEDLFHEYRESESAFVFAELVGRYEQELYNYLRRFLNDGSLAEDVFQATFLQVHLKSHLFESGRKFRPWLYTIATNQAIDSQRRNRRHRRLSLDQSLSSSGEDLGALLDMVAGNSADPTDAYANQEEAEWVRGAVSELPQTLRKTVDLVYFKGMKYRDAANVLSVPVGTVKSRLHAAVRRLGQAWKEIGAANG